MKKLFLYFSLLLIIQSCRKPNCEILIKNPIHPEINKYFFVYSEIGDSLIFTDGTSLDTLFIKSREITDTLAGHASTCEIFNGKTITVKGEKFLDPSLLIETTGGGYAFCGDTTYKKFYFSIYFNESKKGFMTGDSIPINLIDSMTILGNKFYKVLRVEAYPLQAIVYFAPNRGLVQWTINGKNYKLKN